LKTVSWCTLEEIGRKKIFEDEKKKIRSLKKGSAGPNIDREEKERGLAEGVVNEKEPPGASCGQPRGFAEEI